MKYAIILFVFAFSIDVSEQAADPGPQDNQTFCNSYTPLGKPLFYIQIKSCPLHWYATIYGCYYFEPEKTTFKTMQEVVNFCEKKVVKGYTRPTIPYFVNEDDFIQFSMWAQYQFANDKGDFPVHWKNDGLKITAPIQTDDLLFPCNSTNEQYYYAKTNGHKKGYCTIWHNDNKKKDGRKWYLMRRNCDKQHDWNVVCQIKKYDYDEPREFKKRCPPYFTEMARGHCLAAIPGAVTYDQATAKCKEMVGSHLPYFRTLEDEEVVEDFTKLYFHGACNANFKGKEDYWLWPKPRDDGSGGLWITSKGRRFAEEWFEVPSLQATKHAGWWFVVYRINDKGSGNCVTLQSRLNQEHFKYKFTDCNVQRVGVCQTYFDDPIADYKGSLYQNRKTEMWIESLKNYKDADPRCQYRMWSLLPKEFRDIANRTVTDEMYKALWRLDGSLSPSLFAHYESDFNDCTVNFALMFICVKRCTERCPDLAKVVCKPHDKDMQDVCTCYSSTGKQCWTRVYNPIETSAKFQDQCKKCDIAEKSYERICKVENGFQDIYDQLKGIKSPHSTIEYISSSSSEEWIAPESSESTETVEDASEKWG